MRFNDNARLALFKLKKQWSTDVS